jgi:hypothetical protein
VAAPKKVSDPIIMPNRIPISGSPTEGVDLATPGRLATPDAAVDFPEYGRHSESGVCKRPVSAHLRNWRELKSKPPARFDLQTNLVYQFGIQLKPEAATLRQFGNCLRSLGGHAEWGARMRAQVLITSDWEGALPISWRRC